MKYEYRWLLIVDAYMARAHARRISDARVRRSPHVPGVVFSKRRRNTRMRTESVTTREEAEGSQSLIASEGALGRTVTDDGA